MKTAGNIFLALFIIALLGIAVFMFFKREDIAEKLGNAAYLFLLLAALMKAVYYRVMK